jgi:putative ABC transport system permease protein
MIRAFQRRREIALYRALGMTPGQLTAGLQGEGVILGLTGAVLALLLGWPCSYLGFRALEEVSGLALEYRYPLLWALVCLLLCVLVSFLASLYPARKLAREDIATSLHY